MDDIDRGWVYEKWKLGGSRMGNEEINEYKMTKIMNSMMLWNTEKG